MLKRLRRLQRLLSFMKTTEDILYQELTSEDVNNIALLYVDPRYKSLAKLYNNIIINLQNKGFKEMQVLEEFMGVKWTRQVLLLLQQEIRQTYLKSIKPLNAKTTRKPEDLEGAPDGVPFQG